VNVPFLIYRSGWLSIFFLCGSKAGDFGGPKLKLAKRGFEVGVVVVGGASVGGWGAVLGQRVFIALQPGARDLQARQPGRINLSTQLSCCRPEGYCQGVELGTWNCGLVGGLLEIRGCSMRIRLPREWMDSGGKGDRSRLGREAQWMRSANC